MDKAVEYKGLWWLPNEEEKNVAGILSYSPEAGIELDLIGSLYEGFGIDTPSELPVIFGVTREPSTFVTLSRILLRSRNWSIPGFGSERWKPRFAFFGRHLADPLASRFSTAHIEFSLLPEWLGLSGLTLRKGSSWRSIARDRVRTSR